MTSNIKKITGFGLLEVVIALGVLSVGVLGLVKMQAYMEVKAENALKTLDALHIAETQMELFTTRAESTAGGTIHYESISASTTTFVLDNQIAKKIITVKSDVPVSNAKDITVKIEWRDRRNDLRTVELKTVISKYSEFD
ncbi:type IV pilin [Photobacterium carnosum]|uniref:type IV pilus modification PilV family protein n=1 Tax=Photobacterium carnosum TaxID=2023717 RepID=UPI001E5D5820|nr:type IV pilin [Photobacterium carnosum]MCD9556749.1 type IV pilin [Photobacterium carnosum]